MSAGISVRSAPAQKPLSFPDCNTMARMESSDLMAATSTSRSLCTDALMAFIDRPGPRSEEHTFELQSLMRISIAVVGLIKKIFGIHLLLLQLRFIAHYHLISHLSTLC